MLVLEVDQLIGRPVNWDNLWYLYKNQPQPMPALARLIKENKQIGPVFASV